MATKKQKGTKNVLKQQEKSKRACFYVSIHLT